ncbi:protein NLRC3-like isoform 3-T4 [Menidia menidia]
MKQETLAARLQSKTPGTGLIEIHKSKLRKKFQSVFEGICRAGSQTLLNQIYTDLYITEGGAAGVNKEHEVRQIEAASRNAAIQETPIRQEDIFKGPPGAEQPIRVVLTKGVAGIGKTVLTQKFTLDWAEGKANEDIHFLFPFTFRELNVLRHKKFSLVELIHHFFPETKAAAVCSSAEFQVVFIFDGLDESRLPLDFLHQEPLTEVTESSSVDVLLTSLIRGTLLPSARLWITTRPAAANQIPADCVGMVTEVRGFKDEQKEEYFRKRFRKESQASSIISHIKSCRSLHIMCHIPVFCWISATVLDKMLSTRGGGQLPRSLTEMYIHFLVVQAKVKRVKYDGGAETDRVWSPGTREMVESLGKLAFEQLQTGNLIFYESDLAECGIDLGDASRYSGVFTQVFREESGLYQNRVFCFVHLSVQEFLAALHLHLTFHHSGINLLGKSESQRSDPQQSESQRSESQRSDPPAESQRSDPPAESQRSDPQRSDPQRSDPPAEVLRSDPPAEVRFYQAVLDQALRSPNGHLDLVLRFLLGLSLPANRRLLWGLLPPVVVGVGGGSQGNQRPGGLAQLVRERLGGGILSAERSINLLHCLGELGDGALLGGVQEALGGGTPGGPGPVPPPVGRPGLPPAVLPGTPGVVRAAQVLGLGRGPDEAAARGPGLQQSRAELLRAGGAQLCGPR